MSKEPTNGELKIMLTNLSEKISEMHALSIREGLPKRVNTLENWRSVMIWGAGVFITGSLFAGRFIHKSIVNEAADQAIIIIDRRLSDLPYLIQEPND